MDIASAFKGIPTGNICDMNGREGSMDAAIKPLDYHFEMAGYAMTVTCVPGDNLTIHRAIAEAKPGVVLVIQCQGYLQAGVFGELFATSCRARGIAGVVIDGACRDKRDIIEMNYPVFARGVCPNGTLKETCALSMKSSNAAVVSSTPGISLSVMPTVSSSFPKNGPKEVLEKSQGRRKKKMN